MKYIIYSNETGKVWRDLDQYVVEDDGTILGGLNGENTLRYPPAVNPAMLELTDEEFAALGEDLCKYLIQDCEIVVDPEWVEPEQSESDEATEEDLYNALAELGVSEDEESDA